jgi:hypothetical protein
MERQVTQGTNHEASPPPNGGPRAPIQRPVHRRSWPATLGLIALAASIVAATLLLLTPNGAWYLFPSARPWLIDLMRWRFSDFQNQSTSAVWTLLGDPQEKLQPYLPLMLAPHASPKLEHESYTGYSFVMRRGSLLLLGPPTPPAPVDGLSFSPEGWRQASPQERARMLPDLVGGFREGRWSAAEINQLSSLLGDTYVKEQWVYVLGGTFLMVRFSPQGRVMSIEQISGELARRPVPHVPTPVVSDR